MTERIKWVLTVNVRQQGAIGVWYDLDFDVEAPADAYDIDLMSEWHRRYDKEWEANYLVKWRKKDDHLVQARQHLEGLPTLSPGSAAR